MYSHQQFAAQSPCSKGGLGKMENQKSFLPLLCIMLLLSVAAGAHAQGKPKAALRMLLQQPLIFLAAGFKFCLGLMIISIYLCIVSHGACCPVSSKLLDQTTTTAAAQQQQPTAQASHCIAWSPM